MIGWCRKCRAAVELDGTLRCAIETGHGKPKDDELQYLMHEDVAAAQASMTQQHAHGRWHLPLSQPRG